MASVVSTEFVPQPTDRENTRVVTHVFDPVITCGGYASGRMTSHLKLGRVLPPDIKVISDPFVQNPHDDQAIYHVPKPELSLPDLTIDVGFTSFNEHACHSNYGVRIPPKFPAAFLKGNSSGFCKATYAFNDAGHVEDVDIQNCTHKVLEASTQEAVKKWRMPVSNCGKSVSGKKIYTQEIRYHLLDEDGELLPYP